MPDKQIHLAAHFPGVNNTTVWADPRSRSQIELASFVELARTAERGGFDFFFLAEGLRLREYKGRIHDLDVVGRPDNLTVLTALAAVTTHLGLAGTVNSTFNEPFDIAGRLATLDHLSGGRAAWNVVTSFDEFTGENFRRGGFLAEEDRYNRAIEFLAAVRALWDSRPEHDLLVDREAGIFAAPHAGEFRFRSPQFDISGVFDIPRPPQGHPVIVQAGDSPQGRDFAAADADVIFSRHSHIDAARTFYRDVKDRLPRFGRGENDLKIMPAVTYVLGDTDAEALVKAREVRAAQVSPQTAISRLEAVWGRDLTGHDPDGPLPAFEPEEDTLLAKGQAQFRTGRGEMARQWRELAEAKGLSSREVVIEATSRQTFVGTARTVADQMNEFVQTDGADGFVFVPHLTPGGLDDLVDQVIPLLRERGVVRTEYTGTTLREHLGLGPARTPSASSTTAEIRDAS
ncbi:NtaA/DmoA family FMN-dependent monooxygenase [Millisia brevis]|uniref:NtaA/DmoA family FMN-dependent monooxygenase n=1 Tax=Millisia brevis TaxID=264148 RepID=UPI00082CFBA3|nr:NtaA/DmoA family FMN-dependent monooxygenase [Millisia brevis]